MAKAGKNFALRNQVFAFLNARAEAKSPINQIINPDIIGAAACIHGYVARLGFGMTLIKNQIVDAIPVSMNANLNGNLKLDLLSSDIFMIL